MPKNIVIIGAGFGGLRAAILLARKIKRNKLEKLYKVILIDRNRYHIYTPLLYEAATTSKETANYPDIQKLVTYDIENLIRGLPIKFINNPVMSIDILNGDVHCKSFEVTHEELKFDYLILAPGAETNYFNISGLAENSLTLKTFIDSQKIRDAVLEIMAAKKEGQILIGGGGSTGVELAGELKVWQPDLSVTIIEASTSILNGFEPKIIKLAEKRLKKLGVRIVTDEAIAEAKKNKVILKSKKEIAFDLLIWTGGVKANNLIFAIPLKKETKGKIEVASDMQCLPQTEDLKIFGEIYGIGDAICLYDPATQKPLPMVARAAIDQADIAVNNIIEKNKKYYRPKKYPYVIPIGGKYAIAKIGPCILSGISGWILKGLVELNYLLSIMNFSKAIKIWFKGLKTFIQNDRLG